MYKYKERLRITVLGIEFFMDGWKSFRECFFNILQQPQSFKSVHNTATFSLKLRGKQPEKTPVTCMPCKAMMLYYGVTNKLLGSLFQDLLYCPLPSPCNYCIPCFCCVTHREQIYIAPSGVQKERIQVSRFEPQCEILFCSVQIIRVVIQQYFDKDWCVFKVLNHTFLMFVLLSQKTCLCVTWRRGTSAVHLPGRS